MPRTLCGPRFEDRSAPTVPRLEGLERARVRARMAKEPWRPPIAGLSARILRVLNSHGRSGCPWFARLAAKSGRFEAACRMPHRPCAVLRGKRMVLLHGFMKKTQKTLKQDIDLAIKRRKGEGA